MDSEGTSTTDGMISIHVHRQLLEQALEPYEKVLPRYRTAQRRIRTAQRLVARLVLVDSDLNRLCRRDVQRALNQACWALKGL